ncbi:winged helix-turn-helix domain-containing protein [Candidatus Nitrososphaera evergladensis]|uniref:winged helix-turn-helix domain-containing protein n=1 Tax=Candidatus Nitrososphaera evergladensis TaxID=1459637 RepID=UPI001D040789
MAHTPIKRTSNRTKFEILHDILQLCLTPQKKAHIMSRTNLSFERTNHYLSFSVVVVYCLCPKSVTPSYLLFF